MTAACRRLLAILPLLFPIAFAGPFKITVTSYGTANTAIRAEIDAAYAAVETEINKELPNADASSYGGGMSNGTVLSSKGMGVDHASNFDLFVVGTSVGLGADAGTSGVGDVISGDVDTNQLKGFGASAGLMGGVNLGILAEDSGEKKEMEKMNLYFNLLKFGIGGLANGAGGFQFDLDSTTFGVHFQYRILDGVGLKALARWGGLYATVGYQYTGLAGKITTKTFNETLTTTVNSTNGTVAYSGTGVIDLDIVTHSIPIEVSSNVQLFYALTLFGGLGADINFGEAKIATRLENSQVNLSVAGQNATATGSLDLGSTGGPDSILMRGFAGLQFNLSVVKLYAQFNKSFKSGLFGLNGGLRVAW